MALIIKQREQIPSSFQRLVKNLVNDLYTKDGKEGHEEIRRFNPPVNVIEKQENYVIQIALPGWTKKDVDIKVDDSMLVISGSKGFDLNDKFTYHSYEFDYGKFEKRFHLPENEEVNVSAELKDGLLEITIQKQEEILTKKTIQVK